MACISGAALPCNQNIRLALPDGVGGFTVFNLPTDEAAFTAAVTALHPTFAGWAEKYCKAKGAAVMVHQVAALYDTDAAAFLVCPLSGRYEFDGVAYTLTTQLPALTAALGVYYGCTVAFNAAACAFVRTAGSGNLPTNGQIPVKAVKPKALWNKSVATWTAGTAGDFSVSGAAGITLQNADGTPLTACGGADVEIEILKNGISEGMAQYMIGDPINVPTSITNNAPAYLPYFNIAAVQDGSVFSFDKLAWATAQNAFGKTALEASDLQFIIRAKDCNGVWSDADTVAVKKQKVMGFDNTAIYNGGNSVTALPINAGIYQIDDVLLGLIGNTCGYSDFTAPTISPTTTETDWAVYGYTKNGVATTAHRPIYSVADPRIELIPELTAIDAWQWNFGSQALASVLWINCADRVANYYYTQPIPADEVNVITHLVVGNEVYSPTAAVYYNINPIAFF